MSLDIRQAKSHAAHILRIQVRMQIGCSPKAIPAMMADQGENSVGETILLSVANLQ